MKKVPNFYFFIILKKILDVRTSHPDFRVNMIVIYKKFFFRLRAIFENEFTYEKDKKIADIKEITKKSKKPSKIHKLKEFISSLFRIMNLYIYPGNIIRLFSLFN